jgi:hypothetical protein
MRLRSSRTLIAMVAIGVAIPVAAAGASMLIAEGPPGSPDNPLAAPPLDPHVVAAADAKGHLNEARAPSARDVQEEALTHRPCDLVSAGEASGILGGSVKAPKEAPLGPTCVYRTEAVESFVTVALQSMGGDHVKATIKGLDRHDVAGKSGYCLQSAASTFYVPLSGGRVLTVGAAECEVAEKFAAKALGAISR